MLLHTLLKVKMIHNVIDVNVVMIMSNWNPLRRNINNAFYQ